MGRREGLSGQIRSVLRRPQGAFEENGRVPGARAGHQNRREGIACGQRHRRQQTGQLRCLVRVLMRKLAVVVLDVKRLVGVVMVVHLLRMHDHVGDDLILVVKMNGRQPGQCLPDHRKQQKQGSAVAAHGGIVFGDCAMYRVWALNNLSPINMARNSIKVQGGSGGNCQRAERPRFQYVTDARCEAAASASSCWACAFHLSFCGPSPVRGVMVNGDTTANGRATKKGRSSYVEFPFAALTSERQKCE